MIPSKKVIERTSGAADNFETLRWDESDLLMVVTHRATLALGWDMAAPLALSEGKAEADFLREWKVERQLQVQRQVQLPMHGFSASSATFRVRLR